MAKDTDTLDYLQPPEMEDELGRLGHYRILVALGKGGMGKVFCAEDLRLKRRVALKVMNKRFSATSHSRKRFLEEARAMAAVHHDNVVTIFEVGETAGTPYMAMELLKGSTLEQRVASGQPQPTQWILEVADQLARGLSAAHQRGIVHRDIKPGNIWIEEPSGRVKVLDFGLALAAGPIDSLAGRGSVIGTPGYLSPEQARGEPLDDRSDLFSLGVVLYQLACGRMPLPAKTITEQLIKILAHQPERPDLVEPSVPRPLADLIMRLLAKEPRERLRSAAALGKAIGQTAGAIEEQSRAATRVVIDASSIAKARPGKAVPGNAAAGKRQWMKDKRLWAAAAAATGFVLTGLVLIGVLAGSRRTDPKIVPDAVTQRPGGKETIVLAKSLDVLRLADIPAASRSITGGEQARFKVTLANQATSPENDPRVVNRGARAIAQITTFLRGGDEADRSQRLTPGFPKKLSAAMIPAPGQTKVIDVDFLTSALPPGDYEVMFELQSPSGTLVGNVTTRMTVSENLATTDLLGFEKIRTEKGRGADTFVVLGLDQGFGARPYIEIEHHAKPEPSKPLKHAYLRFDLDQWDERQAEIDRALLLMTLEPGGLKGKATIAAYGVTQRIGQDWVEKGDTAITWDSSPSAGDIDSYPFLGRVEFNNAGGGLEKQLDEIRLFGPGLDDYLRTASGNLVTILLVRTSSGDKPVRLVSREGNAEASPALALRLVRRN